LKSIQSRRWRFVEAGSQWVQTKIKIRIADGENSEEDLHVANQQDGTRVLFDRLKSIFVPEAIGHRVVHRNANASSSVLCSHRIIGASP
jgi:acetate kinase